MPTEHEWSDGDGGSGSQGGAADETYPTSGAGGGSGDDEPPLPSKSDDPEDEWFEEWWDALGIVNPDFDHACFEGEDPIRNPRLRAQGIVHRLYIRYKGVKYSIDVRKINGKTTFREKDSRHQ